MIRHHRIVRSALASLLLVVAPVAFIGCGEIGRIRECNSLNETINKGSNVLTDINAARDLDERIAEIEAFDQSVGKVAVERPELRAFIDEYRKLLADVIVYAREIKDSSDYGEMERRSGELSKREKDLVDRINNYCRG
ncbi:MAG: hypothetical protein HOW73_15245 [Polyangiaceae bacterium]|nr:hypothetical protein [Polyangiaceae bacterium]